MNLKDKDELKRNVDPMNVGNRLVNFKIFGEKLKDNEKLDVNKVLI